MDTRVPYWLTLTITLFLQDFLMNFNNSIHIYNLFLRILCTLACGFCSQNKLIRILTKNTNCRPFPREPNQSIEQSRLTRKVWTNFVAANASYVIKCKLHVICFHDAGNSSAITVSSTKNDDIYRCDASTELPLVCW